MKTVYCLRTRLNESHEWSEPEYFATRKERDYTASCCRVVGGYRTHSYEEKMTKEVAAEKLAA